MLCGDAHRLARRVHSSGSCFSSPQGHPRQRQRRLAAPVFFAWKKNFQTRKTRLKAEIDFAFFEPIIHFWPRGVEGANRSTTFGLEGRGGGEGERERDVGGCCNLESEWVEISGWSPEVIWGKEGRDKPWMQPVMQIGKEDHGLSSLGEKMNSDEPLGNPPSEVDRWRTVDTSDRGYRPVKNEGDVQEGAGADVIFEEAGGGHHPSRTMDIAPRGKMNQKNLLDPVRRRASATNVQMGVGLERAIEDTWIVGSSQALPGGVETSSPFLSNLRKPDGESIQPLQRTLSSLSARLVSSNSRREPLFHLWVDPLARGAQEQFVSCVQHEAEAEFVLQGTLQGPGSRRWFKSEEF
jgi:hypothetical protein